MSVGTQSRDYPFAFDELGYLAGTAVQGQMIIHRSGPSESRQPFTSMSAASIVSHTPTNSESSVPFMSKVRRRVASTLGSKGKRGLKSSSSVSLASASVNQEPAPPVPPLPQASNPRISIVLPGPLLFQFPAKEEEAGLSSRPSQPPPTLPRPLSSSLEGKPPSSPLLSRTPSHGSSSSHPTLSHTSDTSLSSHCSEDSSAQSAASSFTSVESDVGLTSSISSHFPNPPAFPEELATTVKHIRNVSRKSSIPRIGENSSQLNLSPGLKTKHSFTVNRDAAIYSWTTPGPSSPKDSTQTILPCFHPEQAASRRLNTIKEAHRPSTAPSCASLRSFESGESEWANTLLEGIPPQYGGGNGGGTNRRVKPKRSLNRVDQRPATSPSTGAVDGASNLRSHFAERRHHLTNQPSFTSFSLDRRQKTASPPPPLTLSPRYPPQSPTSLANSDDLSNGELVHLHPYAAAGATNAKRKSSRVKRLSQSGSDLPPPPSPPPSCPLPSIPRSPR